MAAIAYVARYVAGSNICNGDLSSLKLNINFNFV